MTRSGERAVPDSRGPAVTALIIYGALLAGQILFAVVAGVLTAWGTSPLGSASSGGALSVVWLALAGAGVFVALRGKRRAIRAAGLEDPHRAGSREPDVAQVRNALIIGWGAVEAQTLLAIVVFLLTGAMDVFVGGIAVMTLGFASTFPRSAYFSTD